MKKLLFLFALLLPIYIYGQTSVAQTGKGGSGSSGNGTTLPYYNVKDFGAKGDCVMDSLGVISSGTDDTHAIQTAINYILTKTTGGVLYFPDGDYKIAGALITNVAGYNPNCQIYIPSVGTNWVRSSIKLMGEGLSTMYPIGGGWGSSDPVYNTKIGVRLISTLTSSSGWKPSIIGFCATSVLGGVLVFNYNEFAMENITLIQQANVGTGGAKLWYINAEKASNFSGKRIAGAINARIWDSSQPDTASGGIILGSASGNTPYVLDECYFGGVYSGIRPCEHSWINNCFVAGCYCGIDLSATGYTTNTSLLTIHWCKYAIYHGSGIGVAYINYQMVEYEEYKSASKWYNSGTATTVGSATEFVYDPEGSLYGRLTYHMSSSQGLGLVNSHFSKTYATHLMCIPSVYGDYSRSYYQDLGVPVKYATYTGNLTKSTPATIAGTSFAPALIWTPRSITVFNSVHTDVTAQHTIQYKNGTLPYKDIVVTANDSTRTGVVITVQY